MANEVPKILIAFGSQTGCAQSIAAQLFADLRSKVGGAGLQLSELNPWRSKLDEFAKIPFVMIICSTTGAGDAPDNADRFWRAIRKRTMKPDTFSSLQYAVLALGDTNYDHFCQAGKRLHKRFKALGASCFHELTLADDAVGIEDQVDPWCKAMTQFAKRHFASSGSDAHVDKTTNEATVPAPVESNPASNSITADASSSKDSPAVATATAVAQTVITQTTEQHSAAAAAAAQAVAVHAAVTSTLNNDTSEEWHSSSAQQSLRALTLLGRGGNVHFEQVNILDKATKAHSRDRSASSSSIDNLSSSSTSHFVGGAHADEDKSLQDKRQGPIDTTLDDACTTLAGEKGSSLSPQPRSQPVVRNANASSTGPNGELGVPTSSSAEPRPLSRNKKPTGQVVEHSQATNTSSPSRHPINTVTDPRRASPSSPVSAPSASTTAAAPKPQDAAITSPERGREFAPVGLAHLFPGVFADPEILACMMKEVRAPRLRPQKHKFRVHPDSSRNMSQRAVRRLAKTRPAHTLPAGTLGATVVYAKELTNNASTRTNMAGAISSSTEAPSARGISVDGRAVESGAGGFGTRKVLLVRLKLHQNFEWSCGDAFGVYCENDAAEVEALLERLHVQRDLWDSQSTEFHPKLPHVLPGTSLRALLTFCCSLRWIFQKSFLRTLAAHCANQFEKNQLLLLSSSTGRVYFDALILRQQPSVLELLRLFPSCLPPVGVILSHSTPLMPRYYSVANSPLDMPDSRTQPEVSGTSPVPVTDSAAVSDTNSTSGTTPASSVPNASSASPIDAAGAPGGNSQNTGGRFIEVVFSVVRYTIGSPKNPVRRRGLCTTWLESIAQPFFRQDRSFHSRAITLVHRPAGDFRPPDDVERPLIMVGPGTGVAPFVGFLRHREIQKAILEQVSHDEACAGFWRSDFECATGEVGDEDDHFGRAKTFGETHLFFGCRHRDHDFLFNDELERLQKQGALSQLYTAFSRETASKVYVTHRLRQNAATIAQLIRDGKAVIYVCGDGTHMAKDVEATILDILTQVHDHANGDGGSSDDESPAQLEPHMSHRQRAVAEMELLKSRKRYLQDIWS